MAAHSQNGSPRHQTSQRGLEGWGDMDASASESLDRVHRLRRRGSGAADRGQGRLVKGSDSMKGFPNQISNIQKLADGLRVLKDLTDAGQVADDSSFGEALLWEGIISPGRSGGDVRSYLSGMSRRAPSNQSHRTSARGVKEFFVRAGLAERTGDALIVSELGNSLVASLVQSDGDRFIQNWKLAMVNVVAEDNQGASHPYRLMLRLLKARPWNAKGVLRVGAGGGERLGQRVRADSCFARP